MPLVPFRWRPDPPALAAASPLARRICSTGSSAGGSELNTVEVAGDGAAGERHGRGGAPCADPVPQEYGSNIFLSRAYHLK
jgi:hypothetical protein